MDDRWLVPLPNTGCEVMVVGSGSEGTPYHLINGLVVLVGLYKIYLYLGCFLLLFWHSFFYKHDSSLQSILSICTDFNRE